MQETEPGKWAKPEPAKAVGLGLQTEICQIDSKSTEDRAITTINILGEKFHAMLDNGSGISLIGDKIIKLVKQHNIPIHEEKKKVSGFFAGCILTHYANIEIDFHGKKSTEKCTLAPGYLDYIILGRDFMKKRDVVLFTASNAFKQGRDSHEYIPHTKYQGPFVGSLHIMEEQSPAPTNDDEVNDKHLDDFILYLQQEDEDQGQIPTEVLHNWASEFDEWLQDDVEVEENLESLFPDKPDFLPIPIELAEEKKVKLREIITPFMPMFTKRPGHCKMFPHKIELLPGAKPIQAKYFPMSKGKMEAFDETFDDLVKNDIITPSISPWASNAFVKPKPDGDYRFLVNYKPLNKVTVADSYPIPSIDQILSYLGPANYYTSADASKGFFQIEIDKKSRPLTAFRSHRGLYQFNRLPQGLQNSPFTYQKCVDTILSESLFLHAFCFFDDCITFSQTFDDHCTHVVDVFQRFYDAGFTFNPSKIQICRRKLKYLGFIIEPGKISPDPAKVIRIRKYPRPRNIKDIQRFLGALSYYRRFIPMFSVMALPLYRLTSPSNEFIWDKDCEDGFNGLKNALADFTQVYLPDLNRKFIITCDASRKQIAAILSQEKDGIRYPVYFASRTLTPVERKSFSVSELELAGVLYGISKFRPYIEMTEFTIETDHRAISFLQNLKDPSGRLARWFMILQSFNFTIVYKPGTSPVLRCADALSRATESLVVEMDSGISRVKLIEAQDKDPYLSKVKQTLLGTYSKTNSDFGKFNSITKRAVIIDDGLLLRYVGERGKMWEPENLYYRVWIPDSMKKEVISIFHDTDLAAHFGRRKTYLKLEQRVYWNNMQKDIHEYIGKCKKCIKSYMPHIKPVPMKPMQCESPWHTISIDLIGPFAKSPKQNRTVLVIIDNFTKWIELFPLRDAKAKQIINCLKKVFTTYGFPSTVISDNANQFGSNAYFDYLTSVGIKPYFIPPYHPQSNITERYNQTVKVKIRATMEKTNDWDRCLDEIAFALRTSVNDTTGFTPAYLMFGREFRYPFDNMLDIELSKVKETRDLQQRMIIIHDIARQNILERTYNSLETKNSKRKERTFEKGDKVWYRTHILSSAEKGISSGLMPKLEGPYIVINKISDHIFDMEHTDTGRKNYRVHINDLVEFKA